MSEIVSSSDISFVKGKERKPIHYELKSINGKTRQVLSIRRSKKGGSHYSKAFLDLIYLAGKLDQFWLDKLVLDKEFPLFLEQMREAYERSGIIRDGWSPEQIKELEEYAKKKQTRSEKKK